MIEALADVRLGIFPDVVLKLKLVFPGVVPETGEPAETGSERGREGPARSAVALRRSSRSCQSSSGWPETLCA